MKLALRIDLPSGRVAQGAISHLAAVLAAHGARATFIPALDGDAAAIACAAALSGPGHELAAGALNASAWCNRIDRADAAWTRREMERARARYENAFGRAPAAHAAPAWRMNSHALRLTQRLGFEYASDTRGTSPFIPVWRAEIVACVQLPTTLPAIAEVTATTGGDARVALDELLRQTAALAAGSDAGPQVLSLPADMEAALIERLIGGLAAQGWELTTLGDVFAAIDPEKLPRHEALIGLVPGCATPVLMQGPEFLGDIAPSPSHSMETQTC